MSAIRRISPCAAVLAAGLFISLAAPAAGDVAVSSNEGPFGEFVPGDAGTLILDAEGQAFYRVEYRPATNDYRFVSQIGNFVATAGFPSDAGILNACTGAGTATLVCPEALPGREPYRLNLRSDDQQMQIALRSDTNSVTTQAFPAESVTVAGSNAGTDFENDTGTDVTFSGGSSADTYRAGTGVEKVTMGAGVDTVDFGGYGANSCIDASLDGSANSSVHACSGSTIGASQESGETFGSDIEKAIGGAGSDTIAGNALVNDIRGGDGFDELSGGGGADTLRAEGDGARMAGGAGADAFEVEPGEGGTISYANETTAVRADFDGLGDDGAGCPTSSCEHDKIDTDATAIEGGRGEDFFSSAPGGRRLAGGPGGDTLNGHDDDDVLQGDGGGDALNGAGGDDTLVPGPGNDSYSGSAGTDTVDYSDSATDMEMSMDGVRDDGEGGLEDVGTDVEDIKTGSGDDNLVGDGDSNRLFGGEGDDSIDGAGGPDLLKANAVPSDFDPASGVPADKHCDSIRGGLGNDLIDMGPANSAETTCRDVIDYSDHGTGVDVTLSNTLIDGNGSPGEDDAFSAVGGVHVIGTAGQDTMTVTTATGGHTFEGRGGSDNLTGGPDDDLFIGGLGDDVLRGGGGVDTASYRDRDVPVTVDFDNQKDDGAAGEADALGAIENLEGGTEGDELTGDSGPNRLTGGDGRDELSGLDGADEIDGGPGANVENGGDGDDDITGGPSGGNQVDAGAGADDVNVRNTFIDSVICGPDADAVISDEADDAAEDCEDIDDGVPPVDPGPGPGPGPGTTPRGSTRPTTPRGPGATPRDSVAPLLAIAPRRAKMSKRGVVTLRLTCPAGEVSCAGTLRLTSAKKVKRARRGKAKRVALGRKRFTARGGSTVRVRITLKRRDRTLVKRLRRLRTRAVADVSDAAGNRATARASLLVRR